MHISAKINNERYSAIMYHIQVRLIPGMQGWFNIRILITLTYHTNILRREIKSLVCRTINVEKSFYQI